MRRCYLLLAFGFALACGGQPGVSIPPAAGAQGSPDLHVGDYVVYRFTGSFTSEPVTVRQNVIALAAGRVTLEVHASRGHEERRWLQVGPDTRDARWNNVADELYALPSPSESGEKRRLPNPDNATLARLYEWVLTGAEGDATAHETAACEQTIATARYACTCERETRRALHTESSRCATFAWQRGPARWSTSDGKVVWQAEVIEARSAP